MLYESGIKATVASHTSQLADIMTVKILDENINYGRKPIIGLSTDTKPTTVDAGSTFLELDTKATYMFDGISTWYQI